LKRAAGYYFFQTWGSILGADVQPFIEQNKNPLIVVSK